MRLHAAVDQVEVVRRIKELERGPEQAVQQQVALVFGWRVPAQHQGGCHAEPARRRRHHTGVVGLVAAGGDQHARSLGQRIGHQELQLADLVAPAAEAGIIVPLDAKLDAQRPAKPVQPFHRGGKEAEVDAGEIVWRHRVAPTVFRAAAVVGSQASMKARKRSSPAKVTNSLTPWALPPRPRPPIRKHGAAAAKA